MSRATKRDLLAASPGLLREREVAARLGLSVGALRLRRRLRQPPAFIRIGPGALAPIRYEPEEIERLIAEGRQPATAPLGPRHKYPPKQQPC